MTSDDQHFLDVVRDLPFPLANIPHLLTSTLPQLASIPNDILHYSSSITNAFERNFDEASSAVRERLSKAAWLPASVRPKPLPSPAPVIPFLNQHGCGQGNFLWRGYIWTINWVNDHRAITAAVVAFAGTGGWLLYRRRKAYARKRRAKRGPDGSKREVVVVAGSPNSPLPWSIVLDLERRGFLVYVVVNSSREEDMVKNAGKADIMPLYMNITNPSDVEIQIKHFTRLLTDPPLSITNNACPNSTLSFAGLVLVPDLHYTAGPIETIPPSLWSDALNAKILHTIATVQAFLPPICKHRSRILLLTSTIIPSLAPPFHGVETTVVTALAGFAATLRAELTTLDIPVCHLRLGTFDSAHLAGPHHHIQTHSSLVRREVLSWTPEQRAAYAQNYVQHSDHDAVSGLFGPASGVGGGTDSGRAGRSSKRGVRGTPLRELHNAVFDALTQRDPPAVWRVGRGSAVYEVVGRWVPPGVVGWMMGVKKVVGDGKEHWEMGQGRVLGITRL